MQVVAKKKSGHSVCVFFFCRQMFTRRGICVRGWTSQCVGVKRKQRIETMLDDDRESNS